MVSLRHKLLMAILGGVILVLALSGAAVSLIAGAGLRDQFDQGLLARARTFGSLVIDEPVGEDPDEVGGLILDYTGSLASEDLGIWIRITDEAGHVVAESPDWPRYDWAEDEWPEVVEGPGALRVMEREPPRLRNVTLSDGGRARRVVIVAHAMEDQEDVLGLPPAGRSERWTMVEVLGSTAPVERDEGALRMALLFGGLFGAAGTAIAVTLGVRWGLRPIAEVSAALDDYSGDIEGMRLAPEGAPRELAPMVHALNGLLERLREAMERERRFTDAIAHELRTPIAELRSIAEVAERFPDLERLQRGMRETLAVANEIHSLIESLLAAAREQGAAAGDSHESVALLPAARGLARAWKERCGARGVRVSLEGDEEAAWRGPHGAIMSLLRNLVDNAAEYTLDGGTVSVRVSGEGGRAMFEIENGPVALRPDDVERMFEPFWRGDPERMDRGHRGLGMFVAQSLAQSLGLAREVELLPEGRLRVRLAPMVREA